MDYSDSTSASRGEAHRDGVLRALASAATFGTLGALVGSWLGKHGNDRHTNFAQPMMKWSMGIFCGLLGAYSSLKTTQRIEEEKVHDAAAPQNHLPKDEHAHEQKTQVSAAKHDGKMKQNNVHVALEK